MKNPISLAMPAEATFTEVLVCAKDGKSARPAAAKASPKTAPPAQAAAEGNLAARFHIGFTLPGSVGAKRVAQARARRWGMRRHPSTIGADRGNSHVS